MDSENQIPNLLANLASEKMYFHVTIENATKKRFVVRKILTQQEFSLGDEVFRRYFIPAMLSLRTRHAFYDPTLTYEEITTPDASGYPPASSSHPLKRKRSSEKTETPINEQKAAGNLTFHFQTILSNHLY